VPGYLQLAQVARAAHARLRAARELEARWHTLTPEQQDATRADWEDMKRALVAVRDRLTAGPRGFAQGFGAAYRGDDTAATPEVRPLTEIVRELAGATDRLRRSLDAATAATAATAAEAGDAAEAKTGARAATGEPQDAVAAPRDPDARPAGKRRR
jgi:hypothetical protein